MSENLTSQTILNVALGQLGFTVIANTVARVGHWCAIQCLTNTVLATLTGFSIDGDLTGYTLTAGTVIYGSFTAITLTSGLAIAYKGPA